MKTYLFDTETGVYEGESFEEPAMLEHENGLTAIPPPDYEHGQVPVFDRQKKEWAVIQVGIARQLLKISPSNARENEL